MIEPEPWVAEALAGLQKEFGPRLLYLGLQGSYRRGEATESSDIDLVTILNEVGLDDLDTYRRVIHALPEGHKACGFISDPAELARWPRHELFQFKMDTADHHGRLEDFLPPLSREDIREGARVGASALLHLLRHSYLYAEPETRPEILKEAYKAAFFVILAFNYLQTGHYRCGKKELLDNLADPEKQIIAAGLDFPGWLSKHSEKQAFEMLLACCRQILIADPS